MYAGMHEYNDTHMYTCVCVCICIRICIYIYVYMYICIYVYMYIRIYVYMYICIYVYIYINVYVYVYVYTCVLPRNQGLSHAQVGAELVPSQKSHVRCGCRAVVQDHQDLIFRLQRKLGMVSSLNHKVDRSPPFGRPLRLLSSHLTILGPTWSSRASNKLFL